MFFEIFIVHCINHPLAGECEQFNSTFIKLTIILFIMKLKFNLTEENLNIFENYILKTRARKLWIYVFWGISTLYLVYFYYNEFGNGLDWIIITILIILVCVFFYLYRRRYKAINKAIKQAIKEEPYLPGLRSIKLKYKEFIYTNGETKRRYVKGSFTRIKEIKQLLLQFTSLTQAIIIPKSGFN